jgi:hypothetical protein
MLKTSQLILNTVLLFLVSCSTDKKNSTSVNSGSSKEFEETITFKQDSLLIIDIDEYTPFRTNNLQYIKSKDNQEILIWENRPINALEFYSLESGKIIKRIRLKKEGPQGIGGSLTGFEYISDDSIVVTNGKRYEFYLIDNQGNSYKRYNVYPDNKTDVSVPIVYDYRPVMVSYPYLYIVCKPDKDYNSPGWWNGNFLLKLDILTGEYNYFFKGPEDYYDKVHGAFFSHQSMTINDSGQIIISFPIDSNVAVLELSDEEVSMNYAGSKFFNQIPEWDQPASGESERFYIESNSYREILFDPWRKLYYRFAYRKVDYYDANKMRVNWNYKKPSIIILDKKLNKIGEYTLPEKTYYTRDAFVSPAGLYISINHDENKNADENKLSFQLLKPFYIN